MLSEIKEKKVVIDNERWSDLCFNPLYCWKTVVLEAEGKRVPYLLRENEKTRR